MNCPHCGKSIEERSAAYLYQNDVYFCTLVNTLLRLIYNGQMSEEDIIKAATFAAIKYRRENAMPTLRHTG